VADTFIMRLRVVERLCGKFVASKSSNFLREREWRRINFKLHRPITQLN